MEMDDAAEFVLNKIPISCFYRVSESVVGIDKDPDKIKHFHWDEDFNEPNIILARKNALDYYGNRQIKFILEGISKEFFNLSYASPEEFVAGKNYAYSIDLILIAQFGVDDFHEYFLYENGEDDYDDENEFSALQEAISFEIEYLKTLGISDEQLDENGASLYYEEGLHRTIRLCLHHFDEFKKLPIKEKLKFIIDKFQGNERCDNYIRKRIESIE
ncbi:MAG: hypothetical protein WCL21_17065 [Mariniphaga sp.]|jgi:hypothetical protein